MGAAASWLASDSQRRARGRPIGGHSASTSATEKYPAGELYSR